jgi:hypothetical protein
MDLVPVKGRKVLSYNLAGWAWLIRWLNRWGVDTSEFSESNDGELISDPTCRAVADALEKHPEELRKDLEAEDCSLPPEFTEAMAKSPELPPEVTEAMAKWPEVAQSFRGSETERRDFWVKRLTTEDALAWRQSGGFRQC